MTPLVIPIFIAHQGCPHRCIFCDQHSITGKAAGEEHHVTPGTVKKSIEDWLAHSQDQKNRQVQVAFYGGSFTGLPVARQQELLEAVKPFTEKRLVQKVRLSTRPDYINEEIAGFLKKYDVGVIELGVQSMDEEVLLASGRGHSVKQSVEAVKLLKQCGFTVGVQLMCGLPGDSTVKIINTAKRVVKLVPDFVRIYPALVIKGSGLARMYRDGSYNPLTLNKAVAQVGLLKAIFEHHHIKVVRVGLQPSEDLRRKVLGGPFHPAFGELVASRQLFKKAKKLLAGKQSGQVKYLSVAATDESAFRGPKNINMKKLADLGLLDGVELVFDRKQPRSLVTIN
jgi:histone acetyltransferase (RNA polymerase elongator complex component)